MPPENEQPGFEADVNELPADDNGSNKTLEENPQAEAQDSDELEAVQEEAAEERKEGGYQ